MLIGQLGNGYIYTLKGSDLYLDNKELQELLNAKITLEYSHIVAVSPADVENEIARQVNREFNGMVLNSSNAK